MGNFYIGSVKEYWKNYGYEYRDTYREDLQNQAKKTYENYQREMWKSVMDGQPITAKSFDNSINHRNNDDELKFLRWAFKRFEWNEEQMKTIALRYKEETGQEMPVVL